MTLEDDKEGFTGERELQQGFGGRGDVELSSECSEDK